MTKPISRRELLQGIGAAGAAALLPAASNAEPSSGLSSPSAAGAAADGTVYPLTSTSDVYTPPQGRGFFKLSYDFPEPSVEFEGFRISFRVFTFENIYGLDQSQMTVEPRSDGLAIKCSQLVWAGGQQKASGKVEAQVRKNGPHVELEARAEMQQPIKSMTAIVRGVPRGKISAGGQTFFDPKDDEVLLGYPFGGGDLFTARGMNTPLAVIQKGEQDYFFLSALNQSVHANRIYLQPGPNAYRAEMVFEAPGWKKNNALQSPVWRLGESKSLEAAMRLHYEHVERTFGLPDWEKRQDVPAWLRDVKLAVAPHGMHWTGYIFNDFAKTLQILRWVATKIPAQQVLVFLPAWDGRYYWNYPLYQPDPRLGGEEGFRNLIQQGQSLGFHLMPMFGANAAAQHLDVYPRVADAATAQIDSDPFELNYVDWDNDRHFEGGMSYMNLGVDSWRQWLLGRISDIIERFKVDAYFLDIVGGWVNNTKADMHEGTRRLVEDLRSKYPGVLACGEMHYDALLAFIPLFQVLSESAYPAALAKYGRAFQHLSHPAPGRGSSGVHESGFQRFDTTTLGLNDRQIPTITIVDDTFDRYRDVMEQIILKVKERG